MEPVLRVHNITKRFGTNVANDHITFDLYPGEIHSLLGEIETGRERNLESHNLDTNPRGE